MEISCMCNHIDAVTKKLVYWEPEAYSEYSESLEYSLHNSQLYVISQLPTISD